MEWDFILTWLRFIVKVFLDGGKGLQVVRKDVWIRMGIRNEDWDGSRIRKVVQALASR